MNIYMHFQVQSKTGERKKLPRQRTLTMIPWLSNIESTYRPEPEQVVHSTAPLAWQSVQRRLFPITFSESESPTGFSILSSGIGLS